MMGLHFAAPLNIQVLHMKIDKAVLALESFYKEMKTLLIEAETKELSKDELEVVLEILREKDIWGGKNDATLECMIAGGKTPGEAFKACTDGNETIRQIVEVLMTERKARPSTQKGKK